jgi:glycosyltransferase involved in cell wall biosynthesis
MDEAISVKNNVCYFYVGAINPLNSIRIQIERFSLVIESLYRYRCIVIHPGVDNFRKKLYYIIKSKELLFWHFGGLDFDLYPFTKYDNVYFVYHNITPANFFWRYDPLVSLRSILGRLQLRVLNKNNKWIAVSSYNALELTRIGFQDVLLLPNILSNPDLRLLEKHKSKIPTLIFVGRISPSKGCVELINNVKKLVSLRKSKVRLYVVGEVKKGCKYGKKFAKAINDLTTEEFIEIHWLQNLADDNLNSLYAESWLYVSMSEHEGFGLPACESILYNTPAIYLSSGGQESVLNNLGLVDCSNEAKFVQSVNTYLNESVLRKELLVAQKSEILAYVAINYMDAYKKILDRIFISERL